MQQTLTKAFEESSVLFTRKIKLTSPFKRAKNPI